MSLFGDQEISVPKGDVKNDYLSISISNLVANKFQPRTYFDKEKKGFRKRIDVIIWRSRNFCTKGWC